MKAIYILVLLLATIAQLIGQTEKDSSVTQMPIDRGIDEFILTVKKAKLRRFLQEFAKDRDSMTQMSIARETRVFYEIWVDHRTSDGYKWGEGYTLNKRDGKIEMIWHEQPFKSEPLQLDSLLKKKTEKLCNEKRSQD